MPQNPFANKDGSPQKGKEFEFLQWALEKDRSRIDKLSPKEKKQEQLAANHLRNKMES